MSNKDTSPNPKSSGRKSRQKNLSVKASVDRVDSAGSDKQEGKEEPFTKLSAGIIKDLPAVLMQSMSMETKKVLRSYKSPLPPAKEFAEYNKGVPDAAERVLCMAEKGQKWRRQERLLELGFGFATGIFAISAFVLIALFSKGIYLPYAIITALLISVIGGGIFYMTKRKKENGD